jgi:hypothetical protein
MARTHRDVVQRAAFNIGLKRAGEDLAGGIYLELLEALQDLLLELNEDHPLDFDPTDDDVVPEERMGGLVPLLMYSPAFDQFDRRRGVAEREILYAQAKRRFFASVIGESDFVEDYARDY